MIALNMLFYKIFYIEMIVNMLSILNDNTIFL